MQGLGLPHTSLPRAFWVRIIMRLLITAYLCISLKDLSLEVVTICTTITSFDFQDNCASLWGHQPHLIDEETEAWGRDCHALTKSPTANEWLSRN